MIVGNDNISGNCFLLYSELQCVLLGWSTWEELADSENVCQGVPPLVIKVKFSLSLNHVSIDTDSQMY